MKRLLPMALATALVLFFCLSERVAAEVREKAGNAVRVVRVNDGDTVTVLIDGHREKIRLIGIDAPEMGQFPWGNKAKRHLEDILSSSREVLLEFDIDRHDKYGRLLAYVRTADGRMVNKEMVGDGYAVLFTIPPNVRYSDLLARAQAEARRKKAGIWGGSGLWESPSQYRREHPRR